MSGRRRLYRSAPRHIHKHLSTQMWTDTNKYTCRNLCACMYCNMNAHVGMLVPLPLSASAPMRLRTCKYTWPGSNWRPSACEADLIATRPQVHMGESERRRSPATQFSRVGLGRRFRWGGCGAPLAEELWALGPRVLTAHAMCIEAPKSASYDGPS